MKNPIKPYNTEGWLFCSALWESFYILQPQWWFINSYSLEGRMGMDSFKWTRSDTAPLWTVAWCLFWWWWLNVFLCCISISFALLLSIPQIPHPAKTLHGQCQAISENTFCCFKNGWRNAAKDSTGSRSVRECLWSFTHSSLNPFRVFEYGEVDVWRNTPAEQKTERCFHRRSLFCFLIALATLRCYITAVASVRTRSVLPKTTVLESYHVRKTSNHTASVSRTLSEDFCHDILLHFDHSIMIIMNTENILLLNTHKISRENVEHVRLGFTYLMLAKPDKTSLWRSHIYHSYLLTFTFRGWCKPS